MKIKSFVLGTATGALVILGAGMLMFALPPLDRFYGFAMTSGTAIGVPREAPILWAALLGSAAYAALVTLVLLLRHNALTVARGAATGALVGFLLWFTADLMLYAVSNVGTLATTLIDPIVELIPGAFAGAAVAAVLRRLRAAPVARASGLAAA
jgi:hypothetical protein